MVASVMTTAMMTTIMASATVEAARLASTPLTPAYA
jgi:hypothetical protein